MDILRACHTLLSAGSSTRQLSSCNYSPLHQCPSSVPLMPGKTRRLGRRVGLSRGLASPRISKPLSLPCLAACLYPRALTSSSPQFTVGSRAGPWGEGRKSAFLANPWHVFLGYLEWEGQPLQAQGSQKEAWNGWE